MLEVVMIQHEREQELTGFQKLVDTVLIGAAFMGVLLLADKAEQSRATPYPIPDASPTTEILGNFISTPTAPVYTTEKNPHAQ